MSVLVSRVDAAAAAYRENRSANLWLLSEISEQLALARAGGGGRDLARHRARGKLLARERVELLLDRDAPFLELSPLAAWGSDFHVGASVVTGIGSVEGTECVSVANDPTVRGGATNPFGLRKSLRAMEIAERNRLPLVQLIESGGADLPTQSQIFIPGGAVFANLTRLSRAGIPTVALVFGNSTAGGAYLHWRKLGPGPSAAAEEPAYDPEELLGLAPVDLKAPVDVREILARIVDGSRFDEWKPLYGANLVTGWGSIHGFPVGVLANAQGVLFSEESNKAAHFIQLANQADLPLVFLQNTTGYMVGKHYEQRGIIKDGAKMINAVANSAVPHLTVLFGASYGAGGYGMAGRAYGRRPPLRRGRRPGRAPGGRRPDRGRVQAPVQHRAALRRRHHRPARHPHRPRHRAVGLPYGGGGVGMRVVADPAELEEAMATGRRTAEAAFGDGEVFLERYLERARHVEVQIAGDAHGRLLALFERECSIQRRHQKVIEEAPSPVVDEALRRRLGELAVAAGRAVGCTGLATVEFLLADGEPRFLEINPRLQVEHPVTECVTGWDLVALQIRLAEGSPLPEAPPSLDGHAIEARLYAEDPARGFLPAAGTVHRFRIEGRPGLRVDTGVVDGSRIDAHYDPLLAKVIAHAPTRVEAARVLAAALEGARLHGPPTNRELLVGVLRHPAFLAGEVDTGFLEREVAGGLALVALGPGLGQRWLNAVAAALAGQAQRRAGATLPSGWRNNPSQLQRTEFEGISVGYRLGRDGLQVEVDGEPRAARLWSCGPELVELETDGVLRRFELHRVGDLHYVDGPLGPSALRELPLLPEPGPAAGPAVAGSLVAPLPGMVRRVAVRQGERVEAGALLVVLEAMKTEHRVTAPRGGVVAEVPVAEGDEVGAGMVLAVVEEAPADA